MAADADTPEPALNDSARGGTSLQAENTGAEWNSEDCADDAVDYDATLDGETDSDHDEVVAVEQPAPHIRWAMVVGLVVTVGLAALVGWQGFTAYQLHQAKEQRHLYVEVGRQGALNLTTIDWQHADADVKRVLDSATGTFYDDFSKRQQPFIEIVKKAQATSKGTITEAGLESESGDEAQVLVSVSVKTSNIGAAEQEPRVWRMRISVQKSGGEAKVSNVAFVP